MTLEQKRNENEIVAMNYDLVQQKKECTSNTWLEIIYITRVNFHRDE